MLPFIAHPDWKVILKGAWSVRFWVLAIVLQGLEYLLPLVQDNVPTSTFALLSFLAMIAGLISRFIFQPKLLK